MGPARLLALTEARDPAEAWREVASGRAHEGPAAHTMRSDARGLAARWATSAAEVDPVAQLRRHVESGLSVSWRGDPAYPPRLRDDPDAPALLLWTGGLAALDGPTVAIVGTRDCTHAGREFAAQLGRELSSLDVRVVSGLALGIDGAAHAGALEAGGAPPIGVVGSGLDVVYPRRHSELWSRVAQTGLLLSEHPLGTRPVGWHFLARNRIIAILADVVVVVESHARGGALQTATEAGQRGTTVMSVPGSINSPASAGTNALIRDGTTVCCDTTDVLTALGIAHARPRFRDERPVPTGDEATVLEAIGWEPCSLEQLMVRAGMPLGDLMAVLDRLAVVGWIVRRGAWCERVAARSGGPT
jgi:DNA processing protein